MTLEMFKGWLKAIFFVLGVSFGMQAIVVPTVEAKRRSKKSKKKKKKKKRSFKALGSMASKAKAMAKKAAEQAKKQAGKVKKVAAAVAGAAKGATKAFLTTKIDAPSIVMGDPTKLALVHKRDWALDAPYEDSEAEVNPFTFTLIWGLAQGQLPKKFTEVYDNLASFKAGEMCVLDVMLLIANILKKRIPFTALPAYIDRINYKASISGDNDQKLAANGPSQYYKAIPKQLTALFGKFKVPVSQRDVETYAAVAKSKISPDLWRVASDSRSKRSYSERQETATWASLFSERSKEFMPDDLINVAYWIRVHVGELLKAPEDAQEGLKGPLVEWLKEIQGAAPKAVGGFIAPMIEKVEGDAIPEEWQSLPLPDGVPPAKIASAAELEKYVMNKGAKVKGKMKLAPEAFMKYAWERFKYMSRPGYYSTFAAASYHPAQIARMMEAIFSQRDRDMVAAESAYKEDEEGSELWEAVEEAKEGLADARAELLEASKEEDNEDGIEEAQDVVFEAEEAYNEAYEEFMAGAAQFDYVTEDEDLQASMEGRDPEELSANARMTKRFKALKLLAERGGAGVIYGKLMSKNTPIFMLQGLDVEQFMQDMVEIEIDDARTLEEWEAGEGGFDLGGGDDEEGFDFGDDEEDEGFDLGGDDEEDDEFGFEDDEEEEEDFEDEGDDEEEEGEAGEEAEEFANMYVEYISENYDDEPDVDAEDLWSAWNDSPIEDEEEFFDAYYEEN